jgi:L-arginine dehydrogenase
MAHVPTFLSETDTLKALDRTKVRRVLRKAFAGLCDGSTVQPCQIQTVFPNRKGDCIFYPGLICDLDLVGMKISPYINVPDSNGRHVVTAYTLLLSASSGKPVLLCDSTALTTIRTAATTALALEYLTAPNSQILAVIGTGRVAIEHLRYVSEQHNWSEIRIWSPSLAKDLMKASRLTEDLSDLGRTTKTPATLEEAVSEADVVMLCTSSGTPVIDPRMLKQDCTITSIGTNGVRAHEIPPLSLKEMFVFCDYSATAPSTAGEMVIAIEEGDWTSDLLVGDLSDLVVGKVKRPMGGRVFFRSTGLGIEDLAIASLLF